MNTEKLRDLDPDLREMAHVAAEALKILRLAGLPGMDKTAVLLNRKLTWDEQQAAELFVACWNKTGHGWSAIEIAEMLAAEMDLGLWR